MTFEPSKHFHVPIVTSVAKGLGLTRMEEDGEQATTKGWEG